MVVPRLLPGDVPLWSLRQARRDDVAFVLDLHERCHPHRARLTVASTDSHAVAQQLVLDDRYIIQVGIVSVGEMILYRNASELHVSRISILPEWQSRGIGGKVLTMLQRRACDERRDLCLRVLKSNQRAIALYQRLGLQVRGQTHRALLMGYSPAAVALAA